MLKNRIHKFKTVQIKFISHSIIVTDKAPINAILIKDKIRRDKIRRD